MSFYNIILALIFLSITILFGWRKNKIAFVVALIITILSIVFNKPIRNIGIFSTVNSINITGNRFPFISSKWQDSSLVRSNHPVRIGMVDDFMISYKPYQKSKPEILKLLGKPDYNEELKEWDLVYWLSEEDALFGASSMWFVIEFDSNGAVSEYRTIRL